MRAHLKATQSENDIYEYLRKGQILAKLKKWPTKLHGKPLTLSAGTLELIASFNDIRGDLTHPKTHGHDIYAKLETIDPTTVVDSVAEYIVRYHEAAGTHYPYWLFGWNYLNPRPDSYEIFIINDQQFSFSLQALGFSVPAAAYGEAAEWRDRYLGTFEGYSSIREALGKLGQCEPKFDRFPFRPVLCRRWWLSEHQQSCGNVTQEALALARKLDEA